tara:strand:- start:5503 stop:5778 length:276 start_codon:yes stop_codon:yes gene_type:complete
MSLTDSDKIIEWCGKTSIPVVLDSDGSLVSPTEIWVYTSTSTNDEEVSAAALSDTAMPYMNRISDATEWAAGFIVNPELIDTAGVWTEVTE